MYYSTCIFHEKIGLDICTVATKIITQEDLPDYLLVAHEAGYNPGSQVSLISEFQVREHGCVVDSVSRHHWTSTDGKKGTQMFYPRDDFPIPLKLMKGLMGFNITEPTAEDITTLQHITITNDATWLPQTYVDDDLAISFPTVSTETNTAPTDLLKYFDPQDAGIVPIGSAVTIPLTNPYVNSLVVQAQAVSTWHRVNHKQLDPAKNPTIPGLQTIGCCQEDPGKHHTTGKDDCQVSTPPSCTSMLQMGQCPQATRNHLN